MLRPSLDAHACTGTPVKQHQISCIQNNVGKRRSIEALKHCFLDSGAMALLRQSSDKYMVLRTRIWILIFIAIKQTADELPLSLPI